MIPSTTTQVHQPKRLLYPQSKTVKFAKITYSPSGFKDVLTARKYLAFGDSYVNMFLHVKNAYHIKIKGKSIKGLAKTTDEDRKHVEKWAKYKQNGPLIFNFGQVDFNFIRYYKLIHQEDYPDRTFQDYVQWISSLGKQTYVIGILPTPITRQNIQGVLTRYKILQEPFDHEAVLKEFDNTQNKRERWNTLIQNACKQRGITFINLFKYNVPLDEKFIDQNPKTIHLRYLPCILQLKNVLTDFNVDVEESLRIQEEYEVIKTKTYQENLRAKQQQQKRLELEGHDTQQGQQDHSQGLYQGEFNLKQFENQRKISEDRGSTNSDKKPFQVQGCGKPQVIAKQQKKSWFKAVDPQPYKPKSNFKQQVKQQVKVKQQIKQVTKPARFMPAPIQPSSKPLTKGFKPIQPSQQVPKKTWGKMINPPYKK